MEGFGFVFVVDFGVSMGSCVMMCGSWICGARNKWGLFLICLWEKWKDVFK